MSKKLLVVCEKPSLQRIIQNIIEKSYQPPQFNNSNDYQTSVAFNKPLFCEFDEIEYLNTIMIGFYDFKYPSNKKYSDYPLTQDVSLKKKVLHKTDSWNPENFNKRTNDINKISAEYFLQFDSILIAVDPDETGAYSLFSALEECLGDDWRSKFSNVFPLYLMSLAEKDIINNMISTLNNDPVRIGFHGTKGDSHFFHDEAFHQIDDPIEWFNYLKNKYNTFDNETIDKKKYHSVRANIAYNDYYYEFFDIKYRRAKIKRYFEYNFNLNSLVFQQEILKNIGADLSYFKYLSKYMLMTFHIICSKEINGSFQEGYLLQLMENWKGSGKYELDRWYLSIGSPASRWQIIKNLNDIGLIHQTSNSTWELTAIGIKFKELIHHKSFDPDLPARITLWQDDSFKNKEKVIKSIDSYLMKLFKNIKNKNRFLSDKE